MTKKELTPLMIANILMGEIHKKYPQGEEITSKVGQQALDFCSDYPLYASSSNITYQEAIAIALMLGFQPEE